MKNLILIFCITLFLSGNALCADVTGKVKFNFKTQQDSVHVAVFFYNELMGANFRDLDSVFVCPKNDIKFNVPKGVYIVRVMHPLADNVEFPLVIDSTVSELSFATELNPASYNETIDTLHLVARTLGKNANTLIQMAREGDKWTIAPDSVPKNTFAYTFKANKKQNLVNLNMAFIRSEGVLFFMHPYNNNKIEFSLDGYANEKKEVTITGEGFDFKTTEKLFSEIRDAYFQYYVGGKPEEGDAQARYNELMKRLVDIKGKQTPYFQQALIEPMLKAYRYHPVTTKLYGFYEKKEYDEAQIFKASDEYQQVMKEKIEILKEVDPTSVFCSYSTYSEAKGLSYDFRDEDMYPKFELPFGFFKQLMYTIKEQSPSYATRGSIQISDARGLIRRKPGEAEEALLAFKDEFSRHPYVRNGMVDNYLKSLQVKKGIQAPEFKLVSLNGDTIKLSDYKGKYVFLDFWGSWCGPCMHELPNMKKLDEAFDDDELVVVGIVCRDKKPKTLKAIEDNEIAYINAMDNENAAQNAFGVSSYPSTFLIDKNGVIVAKNLRGIDIVKSVKENMK